MSRYVEVAVQLPVAGMFFYAVPEDLAGRELVGCRVLVPFGKRGVTGMVIAPCQAPPADLSRVRPLQAVLDAEPVMSRELLGLCLWMAEYYEAPPGEVVRAALPAGTAVSAREAMEITDAGRQALAHGGALGRRQRDILGVLASADGPIGERELVRAPSWTADVDALAKAGLVRRVSAVSQAKVRPRVERVAVLARPPTDRERTSLLRAPKQLIALQALEAAGGSAPVARLRAAEPTIATRLRALAELGLVRFEEREAPPHVAAVGSALGVNAPATPPPLNDRQHAALDAIRAGLGRGQFAAYLLHGITGSGKTEVYLHAIAEIMAGGKTAIVLVPEISLTPQLAARFRARFGDRVAVLHSGLTSRERFDEWQRLQSGSACIALGARSAVFAPMTNLGIMVVDEEHDPSFKQDEGVRYSGRDVALVRAQRAQAVCVLGSATPSVESYHAALSGRYELVSLPERATARPLPAVELIDLRVYQPDSDAMITAPLAAAITETLGRGEQVILFLNRRGFDTFVLCRACGQAFRCTHCSVSLTYHRSRDRLLCHYCGFSQRIPDDCPSCNARGTIMRKGLGTEKVADAVAERFAGVRVGRLDRDVATGARLGTILRQVARRDIDILVGTQMVTKGHDFPGVTLVGVLCADTGLSLPDFRASERTFQLLTQVAGRAGRGDQPGRVIIQSYRPDEVAIAAAARHDYGGFYRAEIEAREELGYPPLGHLVAVRIDGPDGVQVERAARELAERARVAAQSLGPALRIDGPSEAPLARLKGRTRWHMWLRAPERKLLRRVVRALIRAEAPLAPGVRVTVDVDPVSAL